MKQRKVEISREPPNAMCRDLGFKFRDDQVALITRSLGVMIPEIGPGETASIILSVLANAGVTFAQACGKEPETFMKVVAVAIAVGKETHDT